VILPIPVTVLIQQISPGQSPEHWGTKSFSSASITFLAIAIFSALVWRFLIKGMRVNLGARVAVYLSEAAAAVGLSLVVSYFDVFKKATYVPTASYQPDWHVVFWASVWAALVAYYLVVKLTAIVTKEGEEFKSKELTLELEKTKVAVASLSRQRSLLVKIGSFARNMVSKKIIRLCTLLSSPRITVNEFVAHLNPELQVQSNMKLIHEFFKSPDGINVNLRLALWMKGSTGDRQSDRMAIAYSWNGESEKCFSGRSSDRLKLLDPLGTLSEVVKFYSLPAQTVKIIPNCIEAEKNGEFTLFYPEQRDKVASMILYKHVFSAQTQPAAVVLALVSSLPNHFHREDEEQFKTFFDEMLTRIEMEWILLQLTQRLGSVREAA
jgi:hypothetical protein